jgi:hypothetical protein
VDVSTRIRRAWAALPEPDAGGGLTTTSSLEPVRAWLATVVPGVSSKVRLALPMSEGIGLLLAADLSTVAASEAAFASLMQAARELAVFKDTANGCPTCQSGDLEMWADSRGALFYLCDARGCLHDHSLAPSDTSWRDLRPASRSQVLQRFPDAQLLPSTGIQP